MKLADQLHGIAQGDFYNEKALYEAMRHPVTTCNDKEMLRRYLFGDASRADRFRLQDLSVFIGCYDAMN